MRLERLYDSYVSKLLGIFPDNAEELLESDPLFNFDRFPEYTQQLNGIVADYARDNLLCFEAGITDGVALAYSHTNAALNEYSVLSNAAINTARKTAANKFISARLNSPKGLSLSHLVWNYAEQAKSEFEMSVSNVIADGLQKGTSAAELGRQVRQYLNNPDMMYRRYHRTVVDANGNKQDVVKWRKRVIDSEGKVRFVEQPLEQVGQGQYRSARKNSERLMRTEINSAYLRSNNERWAQEPFVIGQVISVSPQHPCEDMCDYLAGEYPKDFLFFGWHPQCMCTSDPITISGDEQKQYYKRLLNGEDMSGYVSPNAITDVPNGYKNYIAENHDKIVDAGSRGKLAWHLEENTKYWKDQFSDNELSLMGIEKVASTKLGMAGSKLGRNASKEAYKYYSKPENQQPIKISEQQLSNIKELAKAVDANFYPMSFIEADSGNANVVKDAFNCQSAVVVHEARLRGLNVTAAKYDSAKSIFKALGENTEIAWINPKNGRKPQLTTINNKGNGLVEQIEKNTNAPGRYHIGANYKIKVNETIEEKGHIITAQRFSDGRMYYYDPQVNTFVNIAEFLSDVASVELLKVDKLLFNVDIVSQILSV